MTHHSGITIRGETVYHVRGDTGIIRLDFTMNDEPFEFGDGDIAVLTIKKDISADDIVLQKRMEDGKFIMAHEDTQGLEPGDYCYDVQVTLADGQVITAVGPAPYRITPDVTTKILS